MSAILDQPSERILDPVVQSLTREVAERILAVQIERSVQDRVNALAEKASCGELTEPERSEYERIIEQADLLGILRSRRESLRGLRPVQPQKGAESVVH